MTEKAPNNGGKWKKGQSGNPGGRAKQDYQIKELARKKCPKALRILEQIAEGDDPRAAVSACMGILAYGIGKPVQQVDLTNSDGSMSQAWLAAMRSVDTEATEQHVEH
jgi:hypothetical protein